MQSDMHECYSLLCKFLSSLDLSYSFTMVTNHNDNVIYLFKYNSFFMYRNLVILRKVIPSILRKYFLKLLFFHCLQLVKILEFMHVDRELFRTLQSLNFINVTSKLNVSYSCICFIDKAKISSIC